jgi:hypothetical protein
MMIMAKGMQAPACVRDAVTNCLKHYAVQLLCGGTGFMPVQPC